MKFGRYIYQLATTEGRMYDFYSAGQYSNMPYDEAIEYRKFLLSLTIKDVEHIFETIIKPQTSFDSEYLEANKVKFIAFLKELRRPEDDINEWFKNKEPQEKPKTNNATLKLKSPDTDKIKDFYSKLSGEYIEKGHIKSIISVFKGNAIDFPENKLILWLKPNYVLKKLIETIRNEGLFEESLTQAHWDLIPNIFKGQSVITNKNIQGANGSLKNDDITTIESAVKKLK